MSTFKYSIFLFLILCTSVSTAAEKKKAPRAAQVATAEVEVKSISRSLRLIGNARSKNAVHITSEVSGIISHIYVSAGQKVKKGDKLLELDSAIARASLAEARAFYNDEVRKFTEFRKLNQRGALTKTELDAQQASVNIAKARLNAADLKVKDHVLTAPFSATVGLVDVNLGQFVSIGQALLNLYDLNAMQLDVNVPEQYLAELSKDIRVTLYSKAWPNTTFGGKVYAVDAEIDRESLNFRARIDVQTQEARILPGMLMEAKIDFTPLVVPTVPVQAIEYSGTKRFVYVVQPDSTVKRTEVKLGGRSGENVEVNSGLNLGDRVVKEGLVTIRDGMKIVDVSSKETMKTQKPVAKGE